MNGACPDTDSVSVTVLPMPIANAGNDVSFCAGGSTQLCDTLSLNGNISNWYQLPLWTLVDTDSCTLVSPMTSTDYAVIVSNGLCSDTDTVSVIVYPLPVVDAGSNVSILTNGSTVLSGTGNGIYLWAPATGLSCISCANPTATPTITTTYTLVVTDTATGCMASDTVRVTVVPAVVPNDGLSPNGDGINDVWTIPNIELFPNAAVEVYNRWGELLFSSVGYKTKWDATYKGKELPVGTYYYVINLNSDLYKEPITGPITILR
jgi:gliding motility-associated-like protein